MNKFKIAVRYFVLAFVFVAGHLTFAGMDSRAKAEAKSVFNETEQNTQEENLTLSKKKAVSVDAESTG